uniref:Uncharacterized protein n=1 Tax=Oryza glumipatula TaxID=40148 RepID=A0A0D9ZTA6_9ORYZ
MDIVFGLLLLTSPPLPAVVVVKGVGCRGSAARPQQQQEEEERNGVVVGDWAEERRRRGEERRGNASRGGRGVEKGVERAFEDKSSSTKPTATRTTHRYDAVVAAIMRRWIADDQPCPSIAMSGFADVAS